LRHQFCMVKARRRHRYKLRASRDGIQLGKRDASVRWCKKISRLPVARACIFIRIKKIVVEIAKTMKRRDNMTWNIGFSFSVGV